MEGNAGERRKDPKVRRIEILGSGDSSLATSLLQAATQKLPDWLTSPTAGDCVVELALGGEGVAIWHKCLFVNLMRAHPSLMRHPFFCIEMSFIWLLKGTDDSESSCIVLIQNFKLGRNAELPETIN